MIVKLIWTLKHVKWLKNTILILTPKLFEDTMCELNINNRIKPTKHMVQCATKIVLQLIQHFKIIYKNVTCMMISVNVTDTQLSVTPTVCYYSGAIHYSHTHTHIIHRNKQWKPKELSRKLVWKKIFNTKPHGSRKNQLSQLILLME